MLTAQEIKSAKARDDGKVLKLTDSGGLQLHVLPTGKKVWRLAYRIGGKQKTLSLGPYPAVSLSDARLGREKAKAQIRDGIDPAGPQDAADVADGDDERVFDAVADAWLSKITKDGLTEATLEARRYQLRPLREAFGNRVIGTIRAREILNCLMTIRHTAPAKAERCRIVAGQVWRFAVASDLCDSDPTSTLRGAMPTHKEAHHAAATTDEDIRALLLAIDEYKGHYSTVLALQLAPHVFLRSETLRALRVSMVDLDAAMLTIPAAVMKGRQRDHLVPLSRQAMEIVRLAMAAADRAGDGHLFPSRVGKGRGLSDNALTAALRRMGFDTSEATLHGFRTTASTILHEAYPGETLVIEAQLAHVDKDKVRGAYNRAQYIERRREMMQSLSDRLDLIRKGKDVLEKEGLEAGEREEKAAGLGRVR